MPIHAPGPVRTLPQVDPRIVGLRILWHGWDGSDWDIGNNPDSGVRLLAGTRGFTFPKVTWHAQQGAGVDGQIDTGHRADPREVFWNLRVWHQGKSQAWLDYDAAFWRTLQPGRTGSWEVIQPSGESRRLTLRIEHDGEPAFDTDPALIGWARYGVYLMANQPHWEGTALTRTFTQADGGSFFGSNRHIASAFTLGNAKIQNRGDLETSVVWTLTGPSTNATVGTDGHLIGVPITLGASDRLVIDTNPSEYTAILNPTAGDPDSGIDVTDQLGAFDPAPIPAGGSVPLSVTMTGKGSVAATVVPKFWRAW